MIPQSSVNLHFPNDLVIFNTILCLVPKTLLTVDLREINLDGKKRCSKYEVVGRRAKERLVQSDERIERRLCL